MLCALEGNWYRARFIKYFDTAQWWGPCHRSAWTFYKEKIEYQLEMIYKLRVKVVVQAEAQPLVVSMSDKSNQGVVMLTWPIMSESGLLPQKFEPKWPPISPHIFVYYTT